MDFLKRNSGIIATLALVLAIGVAIFCGGTKTTVVNNTKSLGAASSATTFLPSFGLGTLDVGPGCGDQYTNCTPTLQITSGTTTQGTAGTPVYYTLGGNDYADVEQSFTTATNTPVIIRNPFGSATTSISSPIMVQLTSGASTGFTFDVATTSTSNFATTSSVLVKAISVASGATYDGYFNAHASTTPIIAGGISVGILPESDLTGNSTWYLRPGEGIMLKIASTTVTNSFTGTLSVTFKKP